MKRAESLTRRQGARRPSLPGSVHWRYSGNGSCSSFGKFSAGEAARVNLATILAMQKLVNSNCDGDKGLDLLVLDEILEAVDEAGLASMFEALNSLGGTVLVVSHGNVAEGYPHKLVIVKENGESRLGE